MTFNPYAPPKSEVDDVGSGEVSPPLWNPNAAASWSLVFSPAFGAFLHMKNWQALGEPQKAAASKVWFVVSLVVIGGGSLVSVFLPDTRLYNGLSRNLGLILLLSWYFASAKAQVAVVKSRFDKTYPRRGWAKPLFLGAAALLGFIVLVVAVAVAAGTGEA